jgi:hypothetical protein
MVAFIRELIHSSGYSLFWEPARDLGPIKSRGHELVRVRSKGTANTLSDRSVSPQYDLLSMWRFPEASSQPSSSKGVVVPAASEQVSDISYRYRC